VKRLVWMFDGELLVWIDPDVGGLQLPGSQERFSVFEWLAWAEGWIFDGGEVVEVAPEGWEQRVLDRIDAERAAVLDVLVEVLWDTSESGERAEAARAIGRSVIKRTVQ
jgi:hypothetical protein